MNPPLITLLTDFGLRDGYVGAMKGVIAAHLPAASVVDICHEIPPQDLRRAGLVWAQAIPFFPPGAVHVAVVDPGVGTRRRILAFAARSSVFLAPDNGIIGHVLGRKEIRSVRVVREEAYFLPRVSRTFHGRDIFAPVAARVAGGLPLARLGPRAGRHRHDSLPLPRHGRGTRAGGLESRGEIVYIDTFGNAMTNLEPMPGRVLKVFCVGPLRFDALSRTYGAVRKGKPLLLVNSMGYLEVAVNRDSAAREHDLRVGAPAVARWSARA